MADLKIIMKFGGTSISDGSRIRRAAELVKKYFDGNKGAVVVSALGDATDMLADAADRVTQSNLKETQEILGRLRKIHVEAIREAVGDDRSRRALTQKIGALTGDLEKILLAANTLGEITLRTRDRILSFGEMLSMNILSSTLNDIGVRAACFTGAEAGIVTDDCFGEARPLMDVTKMKVRSRLKPLLEQGVVPVVAGFSGVTQNGETTTLGRGGSDYTATILAVSLGADEVWMWTDVDGIMTGDPKIIGDAKVIPELSYAEASEMTAFGAKAIHPRALEPVAEEGIPVRVRNSFREEHSGTLITREVKSKEDKVVRATALVRDVGMITISGAGMVGRAGTAARIFDVLGRSGVNVLMISQSVSEANITMLVKRSLLYKAVSALETALLGKGLIGSVTSEDDISIVAAIGAGMKGTPGVAAKIFSAVADAGVNVRMIAQGSSELNISFAVRDEDAETAVRAVHLRFSLSG